MGAAMPESTIHDLLNIQRFHRVALKDPKPEGSLKKVFMIQRENN